MLALTHEFGIDVKGGRDETRSHSRNSNHVFSAGCLGERDDLDLVGYAADAGAQANSQDPELRLLY
jgi:hypothetical protein